jgi:hypothetical protein
VDHNARFGTLSVQSLCAGDVAHELIGANANRDLVAGLAVGCGGVAFVKPRS